MKAKELYHKYKDEIMAEHIGASNKGIAKLFGELTHDLRVILDTRKPASVGGMLACIEEVNEKYNAVARKFEADAKWPALRYNGFRDYWLAEVPELKKVFHMPREDWPAIGPISSVGTRVQTLVDESVGLAEAVPEGRLPMRDAKTDKEKQFSAVIASQQGGRFSWPKAGATDSNT